jgi:hypothetical protein
MEFEFLKNFKGQVQPISIVIMTGIVVSLVGVAYFWGVPLIQKRSSMSEFTNMERFISELEEAVIELARSGAGEVNMDLVDSGIKLLPYNSGSGNNSLVIEFALEQPLLLPNTTFYLGSTSFEDINQTGTYGESSPSVVTLRESRLGNQYKIDTQIIYRELLRNELPKRGYVIALCPKRDLECDDVITGRQRITLSFDKNLVETGTAFNGGDLVVTYINVELT